MDSQTTMNREAKAALKPPHSRRFAEFVSAAQPRPRPACGGFGAALRTSIAACALMILATTARGQLLGEPGYDPDWLRNVRLGGVVGLNIKTQFKLTGGAFKVSGGKPGVFDDGYVIKNPDNTADDFTSNWGYN